MLCVAIQGYAKRNNVLRGDKGWLDLKLDNFCSFLTLIAGALRGCARLYEAERGFAWR